MPNWWHKANPESKPVMQYESMYTYIQCGMCVHYCICSKPGVKNVKEDTDRCQWEKNFYKGVKSGN